ncbi:hypothetical protein AXF42_Ash007799 [Apostasia shenzhenica]|uniref:Uncharacterized protein n=1 Tax=Apostasia shenzhenica TaxID=1088818 RepID=A0A2I0B5D5_9ASPA|nr:hypothetical protein AXF42_Ash007799 [Apostasia shenzhenica]
MRHRTKLVPCLLTADADPIEFLLLAAHLLAQCDIEVIWLCLPSDFPPPSHRVGSQVEASETTVADPTSSPLPIMIILSNLSRQEKGIEAFEKTQLRQVFFFDPHIEYL